MAPDPEATPLFIHTHESLCKELISGREVIVDDSGSRFSIKSKQARSILNWYLRNSGKWAGNVAKTDVEVIADQVALEPSNYPVSGATAPSAKRILHLASVRAHRFGGIHKFDSDPSGPTEFYFEFTRPLTLVEGSNGAGKTSFLNAITWCLTGYLYRSQREPENTRDQLVGVRPVNREEDASEEEHQICAVTPLPPVEVLKAFTPDAIPLDTWVELAFKDEKDHDVGKIRRAIGRTPKGKPTETFTDDIGLDPIAREVGTRMPGVLPFIQTDTPTDLGKAVSTLTGIKPLQDLARHAHGAKAKLQKDLVKDREKEIELIDVNFRRISGEIQALIAEHPEIAPAIPLPQSGADNKIDETLITLKSHFDALQSSALLQAKSVLGDTFEPSNIDSRKDLIANVAPARALMTATSIARMDKAKRNAGLQGVSAEQLKSVTDLINRIVHEANRLADLARDPHAAARHRLYAKVASWLRSTDHAHSPLVSCPVCQGSLEGRVDPVTGTHVTEHIAAHLNEDSEFLEKTLDAWCKATISLLRGDLPEVLRPELDKELPSQPYDLLRVCISEDLFNETCMKGTLALLKPIVQQTCIEEMNRLPKCAEPSKINLPPEFEQVGASLTQILNRLACAAVFVQWHLDNEGKLRDLQNKIIGDGFETPTKEELQGGNASSWSLTKRLGALSIVVTNAMPLTAALGKVKALSDNLSERKAKEKRIALYAEAASAISEVEALGKLVDKQVANLMQTLSSSTASWKAKIYLAAFRDAPKVISTDVQADGSLALEVEARGTLVSAYHIANASDLRATLLAFLLSFWRHLLDVRGGLSLLLLDDLQELFDKHNRRRVANTIPEIVTSGGRPITTTNDHDFGRSVFETAVSAIEKDRVDRRYIHPLKAVTYHIKLGVFQERIDERRLEFEAAENENNHRVAQNYVNELRIYIEDRLADFFDTAEPGLPAKPALADLINAIRRRVSNLTEPFASSPFQRLVNDPVFKTPSDFMDIMNMAHHSRAEEITFNDVKQQEASCKRAVELIHAAHEQYERWLRRDARDLERSAIVRTVEPITLAPFRVPIYSELAAFSQSGTGRQIADTGERLSEDWFGNKAIYFLHTHNLGFSAKINSFAIVDLSTHEIDDQSIVIALYKDKVYARRFLKGVKTGGLIGLASEAENPLNRAPSLFLPADEVQLLKVVGIIFNDNPMFPRPEQEAVLVDNCAPLKEIEMAFKVSGNSALPLALPDQVILGGANVQPNLLMQIEGEPAAIATTDEAAFKRIGPIVDGTKYIRYFESIGGLGQSLIVRTEDVEGPYSHLPLLLSVRKIIGVLYHGV